MCMIASSLIDYQIGTPCQIKEVSIADLFVVRERLLTSAAEGVHVLRTEDWPTDPASSGGSLPFGDRRACSPPLTPLWRY